MKKYKVTIELPNFIFCHSLSVKNGIHDLFQRNATFFLWLRKKLKANGIYLSGSFLGTIESMQEPKQRITTRFNIYMEEANEKNTLLNL